MYGSPAGGLTPSQPLSSRFQKTAFLAASRQLYGGDRGPWREWLGSPLQTSFPSPVPPTVLEERLVDRGEGEGVEGEG